MTSLTANLDKERVILLLENVSNGVNVSANMCTLASIDIPLDIADELNVAETLTPLSGSAVLKESVHEILKKLEGKRRKEVPKVSVVKRVASKKSLKKNRSSGGLKNTQEPETRENKSERLFKKKEPKKKDSSIWKRIKKTQE
ncbi:unnamed protein product [Caenorhabditis sp. 36 PRJEB53466]|nr:unnamed protein product [Caenorhabditis sp. 36 PRJEB53466]